MADGTSEHGECKSQYGECKLLRKKFSCIWGRFSSQNGRHKRADFVGAGAVIDSFYV